MISERELQEEAVVNRNEPKSAKKE